MNFFSLTVQTFCSSIFPSLQDLLKCAKLRVLRAFVSYVPKCLTSLRVLRAHVSYVPACLCVFSS